MTAHGRAGTPHSPPVRGLSPRVAYAAVRALEEALLASGGCDGIMKALASLEAALVAPSVDEYAVLEAVHGLEEALRRSARQGAEGLSGGERDDIPSWGEDRRSACPAEAPG